VRALEKEQDDGLRGHIRKNFWPRVAEKTARLAAPSPPVIDAA
jgi:hypothetical protein